MDLEYMKRALTLAKKGSGFTNPNPLVGAVIVKNNKIIGEGYHERYGGPHAEINAFHNATEDVTGATMYVTLEPCSHYGKTPPCADAIVKKGIKRVVVATQDPNPLVAGKGIQILRDHGIEVHTGILEKESQKQNEIFNKYITTGLPFCLLKTAMTLDGKIATGTGDSKWITNEASRAYVHTLRHRYCAIMVGIGTILTDNPYLNTRISGSICSDPIRIVVDTRARLPLDANILHMNSSARTILATTNLASLEKLSQLEAMGIEIIVTPLENAQVDLRYLMKELGKKKIDSILLEGGSELNYSALSSGIVDKVNAFIAPKIIGGSNAKTPVGGFGIDKMNNAIFLHSIEVKIFGNDIMIEGYIKGECE
ncbi:bifunctional diaminohydroxyphosphoribosylaminopyrimidine deaminase/5-amino-6-(5-phosphoribosylamino)uracil reductase RibD [Mobilitalea sibirica]|uniref:Riboflavin biosynthesis protein RibD n=1 Tax=Mobilitalea sibirica TaxID=1462919 RepID=A0A8J7KX01_9FIRM|nr:bifunctional diaminohydroxyphosphoribosylaminopyrimidine deaminase/5-amino-6-(5-phosphoribosylamino)uracil reductase RibD [Mobilitalea sibirica]MBH1941157.1 bifunctional diaminohydroxyphosphoribosylaminopyrimidine deaminase/5-amino-6-(5-phosphoribosylamino)uracil reductase RibD [Mobilitalea sibirica]